MKIIGHEGQPSLQSIHVIKVIKHERRILSDLTHILYHEYKLLEKQPLLFISVLASVHVSVLLGKVSVFAALVLPQSC